MGSPAETRKLIETWLSAYSARRIDDMLACVSDNAALDISGQERVTGRRQIRFALAERFKQFEESVADIEIMMNDSGTRGAAEFTLRGRYRSDADELPPASGQPYSQLAGIFFEVEGGLFSRLSYRFNLIELRLQLEAN